MRIKFLHRMQCRDNIRGYWFFSGMLRLTAQNGRLPGIHRQNTWESLLSYMMPFYSVGWNCQVKFGSGVAYHLFSDEGLFIEV